MIDPQHVANDNERLALVRRAKKSHGSFAYPALRSGNVEQKTFSSGARFHKSPNPVSDSLKHSPIVFDKPWFGVLALGLWISGIAALLFSHSETIQPLLKIGVAVFFGWTSLLLLYVCKRQSRPAYAVLAMLGVLLSLAVIALDLTLDFNIRLSTGLTLCLGASFTLALGAFTHEKFPILLSAALAAVFCFTSLFAPSALQITWLLPTLFVVQFYVSLKNRVPSAVFLLILTAFFWTFANIFTLVQNEYLPSHHAWGLTLLAGLAYHGIGKRMQDLDKRSGVLHTNIAWCIAAIAALGLQNVWTSPFGPISNYATAKQGLISFATGPVFGILAMVILYTSRVRTRAGRQSSGETLSLAGLVFILALLLFRPETLTGFVSISSISPLQFAAYILGGMIAAASIATIVNGARRGFYAMIFIGILTLISELYLVIPHLLVQPENTYIFGYTCLFSILFLAMFAQKAGNSLTPIRGNYVPSS